MFFWEQLVLFSQLLTLFMSWCILYISQLLLEQMYFFGATGPFVLIFWEQLVSMVWSEEALPSVAPSSSFVTRTAITSFSQIVPSIWVKYLTRAVKTIESKRLQIFDKDHHSCPLIQGRLKIEKKFLITIWVKLAVWVRIYQNYLFLTKSESFFKFRQHFSLIKL